MGLNYSWYNKRHKPKKPKELPEGKWLKVTEAAEHYGVTKQTIRHWYLQGRLESVDFKNFIHVKVDDTVVPSKPHQKRKKNKFKRVVK